MDVPVRRETTEPAAVEQAPDRPFFLPDVDIYETDDGWTLLADMPGVDREGIDIAVDRGDLTITGRVRHDMPDETALRYCECDVGNYHRVFRLGQNIDPDKVEANIDDGVLRVTLPKSDWAKTQKIQVK